MKCARCGEDTPRLTIQQRYCPPCGREVEAIVRSDDARRNRFSRAKDLLPR
jgi:predicted RNA-binding Zn-ribbon protein involved in translation (DUF1610 family)